MGALLEGDPSQLGRYWLAARIGSGGQGVVYEGYDAQGTRVAVKALHADYVSDADKAVLGREVKALSRVAPFCTAKVIEADLDHTPPFVVSEFVPGPTLQDRVDRQGAYTPEELHRLAVGIATALSAIHAAGVIHRDLKPANVLLGPDGPRVIDFGIAKTEEMSRSATGQLKGTPRWMAPELFRGQRADPSADVWAWGAIVLFAADGRPPFEGESLPSLMHQVLNHEPETGHLPEPLRGLTERAMSHDPARRPTSQELLNTLIGADSRELPLEAGARAAADATVAGPPAPSLTELAEGAYERLSPEERQAVPRVMLRMVNTRPDARETVRRVQLRELREETNGQTLERVLVAFGEAGLIRGDGHSVVLSSPALLRAWPRLRDWAESERDGLEIHHALSDAARFWDEHGRKDSDLYQGTPLDTALTWAATGRRQLTLNTLERAFLDAAVRLTQRRARTRTTMLAALSFLLVIALGAAALAAVQSRDLRKSNTLIATQRDAAISARIANLAVGLRKEDPRTAARLAAAAGALNLDGIETRSALVTLYHQWEEYIYQPEGTNGDWLVVADRHGGTLLYAKDNEVKVVDGQARKVLRTFTVPGGQIADMALSADGTAVAVSQTDLNTRLWDVATGTPREHTFKVTSSGLHLSPTAAYLVWAQQKQTVVWDAATGKTLLKIPYRAHKLAFSANEKVLVTVKQGAKAPEWWEIAKGTKLKAPRMFLGKEAIGDVAFSPDGEWFAAQQGDAIRLLEIKTLEGKTLGGVDTKTYNIRHSSLQFSADGSYLAFDNTLWRTEGIDDDPLMRYVTSLCGVQRISADGRSLRCVNGDSAVLSISVKSALDPLELNTHPVPKAVFSADGTTLLVETMDDTVEVWNPVLRQKTGQLPIRDPKGFWLSGDGSLLAVIGEGTSLDVWDVRAGSKRTTIDVGHQLTGVSAGFSPDNGTLAVLVGVYGGTTLQFWDLALNRKLFENAPKPTDVPVFNGVAAYPQMLFLPDGKSLLSGFDQGVAEVPSGRVLTPPNTSLTSVQAISGDGRTVASVEGGRIGIFDTRTLERRSTFTAGAQSPPQNAAFSRDPEGSVLATADDKGQIRLWDVVNRRPFGIPLTGLRESMPSYSAVADLVFSPDGRYVLSMDDASHLRTHLVDPVELRKALCAQHGPLSPAEWRTFIGEIPYRNPC
ncbi:serine/threonine-protein kinase [Actinocorallia sp. A-T 12471]|uniref:serine/threonine-protein kinase n=1 Tax=Actinocorallia sp. A-T 12471 TaxID=3089813 RepID=UPI0029D24094|nr:serine/threonine-protein kinase [Actinocorallia sp. A-T 12471]MDX6739702.1 serine/threonine-protein kinase [Actinocorallia sp. A-T 12471]